MQRSPVIAFPAAPGALATGPQALRAEPGARPLGIPRGIPWPRLLATAAATLATLAHAGTGVLTLPAQGDDLPVTVFYPTAQADAPLRRGPYTVSLAENAQPQRGNGHLVVISHGSGGSPWENSDLARALVAAGFFVAVPQHRGDNPYDHAMMGPATWKLRPVEVSHAIDAVGRSTGLAPLLSLDSVGMYGMSAGGHTALTLAGGRWSPAQLNRHCQEHIADDFASCVGAASELHGNVFDGMKKAVARTVIKVKLRDETWYAHRDPRIKAVVAGVPFAADFDFASLARPAVPLALVTSGKDTWLTPRFHSQRVLQACRPNCELLVDIPTGGHAALLSPPPPAQALSPVVARLLADPPGFDRAQMPAVDQRIVAFFRQHLVP